MKTIKIFLIIVSVFLIGLGIKSWISSTDEVKAVSLPKNQFTERIEQEIEALKAKSDQEFCKDYYNEVVYHIDDFYKQNRFGNTTSENNQWKENFDRNLYAAYAEKFIKQAFFIFQRPEWEIDKLKFIQSEVQILKQSGFLESGSKVAKKFSEIESILRKYHEICSIIAQNQDFSYSKTGLSDRFPIEEVKRRITYITQVRNNHLENEYVNNCTRLHEELKAIIPTLFHAHIRYLDHKINEWSGLYENFNSQIDYANNLYKPLRSEINLLEDGNIYPIDASLLNREYNRLKKRWEKDGSDAYQYFANKKTN